MPRFGAFEVITYGGGDVLVSTLNSAALVAGDGAIQSLIRVAMLMGLAFILYRSIWKFDIKYLIHWFIASFLVLSIAVIPKVQVHVTDRFNPGLQGADIGNIPLALGFVASIATEAGDVGVTISQLAFNDPQSLSYSNTGMIYGSRLLSSMNEWRLIDTTLGLNFQNYIKNCIQDDVFTSSISFDSIENSPDLWSVLRAQANPVWNTVIITAPKTQTTVSCTDAASYIDRQWPAEVAQQAKKQQFSLNTEGQVGANAATLSNTVPAVTGLLNQEAAKNGMGQGLSSTADDLIRQVMTITAFRQAVLGGAARSGGNVIQTLAAVQGQAQANATSYNIGEIAQKSIPLLQIAMLCILIAAFPLMIPLFMTPFKGDQILMGYLGAFFYLQLWGPMFVILNKLYLWDMVSKTTAALSIPAGTSQFGGQVGLTFNNMAHASSVNAGISAVAGSMMLTIPVIAAGLVKGGAWALEAGTTQLHTQRAAADTAGQIESTHNVSLNNFNADNTNWENSQAKRQALSPMRDRGRYSSYDASGNLITKAPDGHIGFAGQNSSPSFAASLQRSITSVASQSATESQAATQALTNTWSKADSLTRNQIETATKAWSEGKDWSSGLTQSQQEGVREVLSAAQKVGHEYSKSHEISEKDATSTALSAAVEGSASIGGKFGPFGANVSAKSTASVGKSKDWNETESARELQLLSSSHGLDKSIDALRQINAAETLRKINSSTDGYSQVKSAQFADAKTFQEALAKTQTESKQWSKLASYAESNGIQFTSNLTNGLTNYINERLNSDNPPSQPGGRARYGPNDLGAFMNEQTPDPNIRAVRDVMIEQYAAKVARGIVTPSPEIEATRQETARDASGLKNPGEFTVKPATGVGDGGVRRHVAENLSHGGKIEAPKSVEDLDKSKDAQGLHEQGRQADAAGGRAHKHVDDIKKDFKDPGLNQNGDSDPNPEPGGSPI